MLIINLNHIEMFSAKEAAQRWGYSEGYVRQMIHKYPAKFPDGSVRKIGNTYIITRTGMIAATGHDEANRAVANLDVNTRNQYENAMRVYNER